jgi:hypothetical protein
MRYPTSKMVCLSGPTEFCHVLHIKIGAALQRNLEQSLRVAVHLRKIKPSLHGCKTTEEGWPRTSHLWDPVTEAETTNRHRKVESECGVSTVCGLTQQLLSQYRPVSKVIIDSGGPQERSSCRLAYQCFSLVWRKVLVGEVIIMSRR